ncbi:MAG TPA: hypothetical protein VEI81_02590 [Methanoregula sp.]|nr:hypothetical protein [Methanoregula sp.]
MQDVRLRIASAAILSAAAFSGPWGAAGAFVWWIVFCSTRVTGSTLRRIALPFALVSVFGAVIWVTGGQGLTYIARMGVILLVASWAYDEYRPGEFLDLSVWLLGDRIGFDLGLVAEMGMQSLELLIADFSRIRMALTLKGKTGIRTLVPAGLILIHVTLGRAGETGSTLAVRGYQGGGTLKPGFRAGRFDVPGFVAAFLVGIFAFAPVSEFFILYR